MQGVADAEFLVHGLNEQPIRLNHDLRIAGFHAQDNVVIGFIAGNAQEFHRTLDHAHGRIAIPAHDAVAQGAMIGTDTHRRAVLPTDADQGRESFPDPVDLFLIVGIGVFYEFELLLIDVIARVDSDFLHDACSDLRGIRCEVYIGYQRGVVAPATKFVADHLQVLRFLLGGGGDAYQFCTRLDASDGLLDRGDGIHRIGGRHGLHPDGMAIAQQQITDPDFQGFQALIGREGGTIGLKHVSVDFGRAMDVRSSAGTYDHSTSTAAIGS